ncbi:hypothetical protein C2E23DRAFT_729891 [Lenzites betulinus]|nr:hypothetical protein C2E23DRAFT_729891 [Lenzites betulinus]
MLIYLQIVKLHWFFNHGEIVPDLVRNDPGREYINSMGEMELVSLSHDTYTFADRIWAIEPLIGFNENGITLPVIDEHTHVYRQNKSLVRSFDVNQPMLEHRICWELCNGYYNLYAGNHPLDILRWCDKCSKWFHTSCCQLSKINVVTLGQPHVNRPKQPLTLHEATKSYIQGDVPFTPLDWELWQKLRFLPVQRGMHGVDYPLSFEKLVAKIRKQDDMEGCPVDVQEFLLANINLATHLKATPYKFLAIFQAWVPTDFYECPRCGCDI